MNVQPAKISSEIQSLVDGEICEILVSEGDDFFLCD